MNGIECIARRKGPEDPRAEEIFEHPSVIQGKNDYLALASGQLIRAQVVVGGETYELDWGGFDSQSKYIISFGLALKRGKEKREEGIETSVRLIGTSWSSEYLPLLKEVIEDIRHQLFGFGWQALESGNIITAYSAFRASEFLYREQIVEKLRGLFRKDFKAKRILESRWSSEFGLVRGTKWRIRHITKRPERQLTHWEKKRLKKAEKTIERARQSIDVLSEILL